MKTIDRKISVFFFISCTLVIALIANIYISYMNRNTDEELPSSEDIKFIHYKWRTTEGNFKTAEVSSPENIKKILSIINECLSNKSDGMPYDISAAEMHILLIYRDESDIPFRISVLGDHYYDYKGYKYNVSNLVKFLKQIKDIY